MTNFCCFWCEQPKSIATVSLYVEAIGKPTAGFGLGLLYLMHISQFCYNILPDCGTFLIVCAVLRQKFVGFFFGGGASRAYDQLL